MNLKPFIEIKTPIKSGLLLIVFCFTTLPVFANPTIHDNTSGFSNYQLINIAILVLLIASGYFYWKRYKQLESLKQFYSAAIKYHFDKSVKANDSDAEIKRKKLLNKSEDIFNNEHRFAIRVPVSTGLLTVYWKDENGHIQSGDAINISVHGIKFHCDSPNIDHIDKIVCPKLKTTFILSSSPVHYNEDQTAVATVDRFQNDTEDQIRWVELITSLYTA